MQKQIRLQKQIHIARELFLVKVGLSSRCAQPTVRLFMFDFFYREKLSHLLGITLLAILKYLKFQSFYNMGKNYNYTLGQNLKLPIFHLFH